VLKDVGKGFYLIARDGSGAIAGYLYVTYEWSDWRDGDMYWVRQAVVGPDQRGEGVFRAMFDALRAKVETDGIRAIRYVFEQGCEDRVNACKSVGLSEGVYYIETKRFN
jgi:hypothetical protein